MSSVSCCSFKLAYLCSQTNLSFYLSIFSYFVCMYQARLLTIYLDYLSFKKSSSLLLLISLSSAVKFRIFYSLISDISCSLQIQAFKALFSLTICSNSLLFRPSFPQSNYIWSLFNSASFMYPSLSFDSLSIILQACSKRSLQLERSYQQQMVGSYCFILLHSSFSLLYASRRFYKLPMQCLTAFDNIECSYLQFLASLPLRQARQSSVSIFQASISWLTVELIK